MQALKYPLYLDIHQHCYMKTRQQAEKYLGGFNAFHEFFMDDRKSLDADRSMAYSVYALHEIHRLITQNEDARGGLAT